jgi:hypothetical protein
MKWLRAARYGSKTDSRASVRARAVENAQQDTDQPRVASHGTKMLIFWSRLI